MMWPKKPREPEVETYSQPCRNGSWCVELAKDAVRFIDARVLR
jgi:hypothetical protein